MISPSAFVMLFTPEPAKPIVPPCAEPVVSVLLQPPNTRANAAIIKTCFFMSLNLKLKIIISSIVNH